MALPLGAQSRKTLVSNFSQYVISQASDALIFVLLLSFFFKLTGAVPLAIVEIVIRPQCYLFFEFHLIPLLYLIRINPTRYCDPGIPPRPRHYSSPEV
jgi:hypothetical protein